MISPQFKIGDILIWPDWQIILILDVQKETYYVRILKSLGSDWKVDTCLHHMISHIDFYYKLITPLEKIKYL